MAKKPTTIDEYLATVCAPQRPALQKIRAAVHAAAPRAEEAHGARLQALVRAWSALLDSFRSTTATASKRARATPKQRS